MSRVIVIGAGGHARVLIEAVAGDRSTRLIGILDNDTAKWNTSVLGVPIIGGDDALDSLVASKQCDSFVVAVGALEKTPLRKSLFENAKNAGLAAFTVRHRTSLQSPSSSIASGCQLLAQSVVNAGASIHENVIVNTGAIVEHDCVVEPDCHLAPRAVLAGGVYVGGETHIGLGAVVRENLKIGNGVVVGAGAVVVDDIPDNMVVVGVPARPLRKTDR